MQFTVFIFVKTSSIHSLEIHMFYAVPEAHFS